MAEIKSLNAKLDKILSVVAPTTVHEIPLKKESSAMKTTKTATKKKPAAKKTTKKTTKKKAAKK